jgi:hypothetical protein
VFPAPLRASNRVAATPGGNRRERDLEHDLRAGAGNELLDQLTDAIAQCWLIQSTT